MDVLSSYKKIQQKYNLMEGVQELFLYETYLGVCKEYFSKLSHPKAAIFGAGENTKEIISSAIWGQIKNYVKVIIDNHSHIEALQNIPVIREQEIAEHDIDVVLISSWNYREDMARSVSKNFPQIEIFDPYNRVLEELPEISNAFFTYKSHQKYQWFAKRRKALESTSASGIRQQLLKELVHGYYAINDWVDLEETLLLYCSEDYEDKQKYLSLKRDVETFLCDIKGEIEERNQRDYLIFLVDSLSKYVIDKMPRLSEWGKKGISFEKYINEYPSTREVVTSLLTGWHCFEDKTYLSKKIQFGDSDLLKNIDRDGMEIKLISSTHSAENYSEINCYAQGIHEDMLLTEVLFRGIGELLKSARRQIIIMHTFDTVHPHHYNPIASELDTNVPWETHKKRFKQSVLFTDNILHFYLNLLDGSEGLTKIILGDHGINLEAEYAYGVAHVPITGDIGLWDLETISPAFIILNKNLRPQTINKFVLSCSFHKILGALMENQEINEVLEDKKFLELEFVPGYAMGWLEDCVVKSHNYYLGMGMKGIISPRFIFASFEDGTERLFKICGKELMECNDQLAVFIDEVGEENWSACKFPNDLLKEQFFERHNMYYSADFKDSWRILGEQCIIRNIDLEITEKCSLKCKDCFNCMQYYKRPQDIPLDIIKKSLDILTNYVDFIKEIRILGGEPFMNKNLKEITAYVCAKNNVERVVIYTNATILPQKDQLEIFQHEKVSFYISDYGIEERQKLDQLEKLLTEYRVPYKVHKLDFWYKPGKIFDNHRSAEELKSAYRFCWGRDCITLLDGKLFQCEFAANANRLRAIPDFKADYVDLFELDNLRNRLVQFLYRTTAMDSCKWCNLTVEKVKPGVQILKSLDYTEIV